MKATEKLPPGLKPAVKLALYPLKQLCISVSLPQTHRGLIHPQILNIGTLNSGTYEQRYCR